MNAGLVPAILAATLPTLAVLIGILINRTDTTRLSGEIATLRAEMREEIGDVRGEIGDVRGEIGTLRGEMHAQSDSLSSKIDAMRLQLHNDIVMLMNIDREQDIRITRLESRS